MSQTAVPQAFPQAAPEAHDETAQARQLPPLVNEDWTAVIVGAALIAMVLLGVRPATPRFAWGTEQAPAAALVAAENLARSAQVGLLVLAPLVAGAAVLRARVPAFVPGALLLFALAWVAQAMAGYVGAAGLGAGVRDLRAGDRPRHQPHRGRFRPGCARPREPSSTSRPASSCWARRSSSTRSSARACWASCRRSSS